MRRRENSAQHHIVASICDLSKSIDKKLSTNAGWENSRLTKVKQLSTKMTLQYSMHFQCRCLCLMSWIKSTKGMMGYSTEVQVSCYIIKKQPLPTELWRWSSLSLWLVSWSLRITCALNLCTSQLEHHGNVFGLRPIWSFHIKLHIHEVIHLHGNWQRVFTVPTHWGLTDRNHHHHSYPNAGIHTYLTHRPLPVIMMKGSVRHLWSVSPYISRSHATHQLVQVLKLTLKLSWTATQEEMEGFEWIDGSTSIPRAVLYR
jgi:hypothetical protein